MFPAATLSIPIVAGSTAIEPRRTGHAQMLFEIGQPILLNSQLAIEAVNNRGRHDLAFEDVDEPHDPIRSRAQLVKPFFLSAAFSFERLPPIVRLLYPGLAVSLLEHARTSEGQPLPLTPRRVSSSANPPWLATRQTIAFSFCQFGFWRAASRTPKS